MSHISFTSAFIKLIYCPRVQETSARWTPATLALNPVSCFSVAMKYPQHAKTPQHLPFHSLSSLWSFVWTLRCALRHGAETSVKYWKFGKRTFWRLTIAVIECCTQYSVVQTFPPLWVLKRFSYHKRLSSCFVEFFLCAGMKTWSPTLFWKCRWQDFSAFSYLEISFWIGSIIVFLLTCVIEQWSNVLWDMKQQANILQESCNSEFWRPSLSANICYFVN